MALIETCFTLILLLGFCTLSMRMMEGSITRIQNRVLSRYLAFHTKHSLLPSKAVLQSRFFKNDAIRIETITPSSSEIILKSWVNSECLTFQHTLYL
ncbi:MAG: hypothetical protein HY390_06295 [Deltaproteobacteria bacterium]|nr:hypothetical protein [Deltaproteobacteria bacterium]